ncbi:hypothetical protein CBL_14546 [Carabus blaptoides fortunei]
MSLHFKGEICLQSSNPVFACIMTTAVVEEWKASHYMDGQAFWQTARPGGMFYRSHLCNPERRAHLRFAYNEIPASSGHLRFQYTWCCGQTGPRPRVIPAHELHVAIEHVKRHQCYQPATHTI